MNARTRANPTASVVVPTYRRPRTISDVIASGAKQVSSDREPGILDDDRVQSSAQAEARAGVECHGHDAPTVYVMRERNRSASTARDAGLRCARRRGRSLHLVNLVASCFVVFGLALSTSRGDLLVTLAALVAVLSMIADKGLVNRLALAAALSIRVVVAGTTRTIRTSPVWAQKRLGTGAAQASWASADHAMAGERLHADSA